MVTAREELLEHLKDHLYHAGSIEIQAWTNKRATDRPPRGMEGAHEMRNLRHYLFRFFGCHDVTRVNAWGSLKCVRCPLFIERCFGERVK